MIWYHGRSVKSTKFDPKYTGRGTDQQGPGFYFSSDLKDAASYAYPNGIVIKAKLNLRKELPDKGRKANEKEIKFLMDKALDLDGYLTNWDENPSKAYNKAFNSFMDDELPYQQVWADLYRYEPELYLKNLVKLGYDGHESPVDSDARHMIVYNPKSIEVLEVIDYKDVDKEEVTSRLAKHLLDNVN